MMADSEIYKCIFSGIRPHLRSDMTKPKIKTFGFEVLLLFLFIALMLLDNFACTLACFDIRTI